MIKENYDWIINKLKSSDKVLDIGAWERPFNRANWVLDVMPYETRKKHNSFPLKMSEYFSKRTWKRYDISNKLPFKDKEFDFVICGHVLEDIKDPVNLCNEIMRIGKAGYFEFPNRAYETQTSVDPYVNSQKYIGYCHHRWFIQINRNSLYFVPKNYAHNAVSVIRCNKIHKQFDGFFWHDRFLAKEFFFSSFEEIIKEALEYKAHNDSVSLKYLTKKYVLYKFFNLPISRLIFLMKHLKFDN